ncbi:MAG TPA: cob(I)yrinic acid a,c-diamide adenosyltransferase [Gaiellaceae bacterium]|nr:cob(I)yrinic acid a,c-diamide adenosyltransferase [Gaiellaceae bacterium]
MAFKLGPGGREPMTKIYTKTGDDGTTGLLFGGRLSKADALVDAYGDVDEAVSALGVARAACEDAELAALVLRLQRGLFVAAADLAANPRQRDRLEPGISRVDPALVDELEQTIDRLVAARPLRQVFVVPGANPASAALDLARSVLRRAERHAVGAAAEGHHVSPQVVAYLNRLGDLLYVLARGAAGDAEEPPSHS